jgi:hypothetical protein
VLLAGVEVVGRRRRFHTVQKTNDFVGEYTFYTAVSKIYSTFYAMKFFVLFGDLELISA